MEHSHGTFLKLKLPKSIGDFSQEDIDTFTEFFEIPPANHGLFPLTQALENISAILFLFNSDEFSELQKIARVLNTHRKTPEILTQNLQSTKSSRTGFAATNPVYECLIKIPHSSSGSNIFELLTALLFLARKHSRTIKDLSLSNNEFVGVAREIRTLADRGKPYFETLSGIPVELNSYELPKKALDEFEKLFPAISNSLKKIIRYFSNEQLVRPAKSNGSKPKPRPGSSKNKRKTPYNPFDRPISQPVTRRQLLPKISPNSARKNDDEELLILPENDQEIVQQLGELLDDTTPQDKAKVDPNIDGEPLSVEGIKTAAQATQQKGVMQAQFCKYRWEQLSQAENHIIQEHIRSQECIEATAALLTLALGAEPIVWGEYELTHSAVDKAYFDIPKMTWGHSIYEHKNAWQPDDNLKSYLSEVGNQVELFIPKLILQRFQEVQISSANNLAELLGSSPEKLQEVTAQWLLSLSPRNRGLTLAKLRNQLYFTVMQLTMDEVAAHFICGQPTFLLPIQAFYTAFDTKSLNEIYQKTLAEIFDSKISSQTSDSNQKVGSKLQVDKCFHREFVLSLKEVLNNIDVKDFVAYHNHFTIYTHQLLSYATGHRDVVDPFARPQDFIESIRSVLVFDKESDVSHMGRISPMGRIAWSQFETYQKHLHLLAIQLRANGESFASKIEQLLQGKQTLPFLFLLESTDTGL
ncbi:hypothetical protein THIOSC15_1530004 [uncultured Thiomicrorhabdus sp.]